MPRTANGSDAAMPVPDEPAHATVARRLRTQGRACGQLGSPLYAELLERAAADAESRGLIWEALRGHENDPGPWALALRFLGGLHRLALQGSAPELAAHYPSCGGDGDADGAWAALRGVVEGHMPEVRAAADRGVQTNEVSRSAALLGGFLTVARESGRPLRVLEVGASAGLNLRWDHFRYEEPSGTWGPAASPLVLRDHFAGPQDPPFSWPAEVVERAGCDPAPVDPVTAEGQLTLLCFVWPDQDERLARLRAAFEVAAAVPAVVDRAEAAPWLAERLARSAAGTATVVYHSIVMQYLSSAGRQEVVDLLARAGEHAGSDAPLAWLRMEPTRTAVEVRLTYWPGGQERLLATANAHGRQVVWLAEGAPGR
jgi:hypothetical protein